MSGYNHPKADLSKGQYGLVGHGLHIARKLLPFIPEKAGILLVPCGRGEALLLPTVMWGHSVKQPRPRQILLAGGVGQPLYQDLISRTKAALEKSPENVLLAVVWMQGGSRPSVIVLRTAAGPVYRNGQSVPHRPWRIRRSVYRWFSGRCAVDLWGTRRTTGKKRMPRSMKPFMAVTKNRKVRIFSLCRSMTDENGNNTPTNLPAEDPDIVAVGVLRCGIAYKKITGRQRSVICISAHGRAGVSFQTALPLPFSP